MCVERICRDHFCEWYLMVFRFYINQAIFPVHFQNKRSSVLEPSLDCDDIDKSVIIDRDDQFVNNNTNMSICSDQNVQSIHHLYIVFFSLNPYTIILNAD